jgi:hypothetical protein
LWDRGQSIWDSGRAQSIGECALVFFRLKWTSAHCDFYREVGGGLQQFLHLRAGFFRTSCLLQSSG